jgi:hypothetical protein
MTMRRRQSGQMYSRDSLSKGLPQGHSAQYTEWTRMGFHCCVSAGAPGRFRRGCARSFGSSFWLRCTNTTSILVAGNGPPSVPKCLNRCHGRLLVSDCRLRSVKAELDRLGGVFIDRHQ